jgi:flagellar motor component MotA
MFVGIGYLIALGCIFGGYMLHGGNLKVVTTTQVLINQLKIQFRPSAGG